MNKLKKFRLLADLIITEKINCIDPRIDLIFNLENEKRSDFIHHRASGLNQVISKELKSKKIFLGFSIKNFLTIAKKTKAKFLGRVSQNIFFGRKFKFDIRAFSFASDIFGLRNRKDIESLFIVLGASTLQIKNIFSLSKRIKDNQRKIKEHSKSF